MIIIGNVVSAAGGGQLECLEDDKMKSPDADISKCVDTSNRQYEIHGITEILSSLNFMDKGMNVCILGPSDSGKAT